MFPKSRANALVYLRIKVTRILRGNVSLSVNEICSLMDPGRSGVTGTVAKNGQQSVQFGGTR